MLSVSNHTSRCGRQARLLFPARLFQGALGRRGGWHSWASEHWGDKPKCPKNRGEGLESLVMCDSVLETVWGRFVKALQSGKEGRVVGKGPLEDVNSAVCAIR
jgi:hypothetical protein